MALCPPAQRGQAPDATAMWVDRRGAGHLRPVPEAWGQQAAFPLVWKGPHPAEACRKEAAPPVCWRPCPKIRPRRHLLWAKVPPRADPKAVDRGAEAAPPRSGLGHSKRGGMRAPKCPWRVVSPWPMGALPAPDRPDRHCFPPFRAPAERRPRESLEWAGAGCWSRPVPPLKVRAGFPVRADPTRRWNLTLQAYLWRSSRDRNRPVQKPFPLSPTQAHHQGTAGAALSPPRSAPPERRPCPPCRMDGPAGPAPRRSVSGQPPPSARFPVSVSWSPRLLPSPGRLADGGLPNLYWRPGYS